MEDEDRMNPSVRHALADSIARVAETTASALAPPQEFQAMLRDEGMASMPEIGRVIQDTLRETSSLVKAGRNDEAARLLTSTQALIATFAAEIELQDSLVSAAHSAVAATLKGWLSRVKSILGKLAAWIWDVIKTMLTPTGWSVEGGVTLPGLADAKLKITFGKSTGDDEDD